MPTSFADALQSAILTFVDIGTWPRPTRVSPVDIDYLSVRTIKPNLIPFPTLALGFGSDAAVVATGVVEDYVVAAPVEIFGSAFPPKASF